MDSMPTLSILTQHGIIAIFMNRQMQQEQLDVPLDGTLSIRGQFRDLIGMEFIEGLHSTLRFEQDGALPTYNAAGRNYYVALPEPIGMFDSLQIAGGGNYDMGIRSNDVPNGIVTIDVDDGATISPPSESADIFTSTTTYYEDGQLVHKENANPVGSYSSLSADRKISNAVKIGELLASSDSNVVVPIQIGKFEYAVKDQNGDPQVAILMLTPNMGKRLGEVTLLPLEHAIGYPETPPEEFAQLTQKHTDKQVKPRLEVVGAGIAEIHKVNINHNQLTGHNVDALLLGDGTTAPYITDWDTMTTPIEDDRARAQALDILVAVRSLSGLPLELLKKDLIDIDLAAEIIIKNSIGIIGGYILAMGKPLPAALPRQTVFEIALDDTPTNRSLDLLVDILN